MNRLEIRNNEEKQVALKELMVEKQNLGVIVDRIKRQAEAEANANGESGGCLYGFGNWLSKRFRSKRGEKVSVSQGTVEMSETACETPSVSAVSSRKTHSAIFGLGSRKSVDPSAKLAEAAEAMEQRIEGLQLRAVQHRAQAAEHMRANQKAAALMMLKKAKMVERQAESNQASLMAVEQQVDMLAQAHMQRTVTMALSASSKGLKNNKKMLQSAEAAVDDAEEARDVAQELGQVMSDFAQNGGGGEGMDEDDLLAELKEMMSADDDVNGGGGAASSEGSDLSAADTEIVPSLSNAQLAAKALEAKHAEWDEAEALRQQMPAAPANKKKSVTEEQTKLLSSGVV